MDEKSLILAFYTMICMQNVHSIATYFKMLKKKNEIITAVQCSALAGVICEKYTI